MTLTCDKVTKSWPAQCMLLPLSLYMSTVSAMPEEDADSPRVRLTGGCELPVCMGPPEEHYMRLTAQSSLPSHRSAPGWFILLKTYSPAFLSFHLLEVFTLVSVFGKLISTLRI